MPQRWHDCWRVCLCTPASQGAEEEAHKAQLRLESATARMEGEAAALQERAEGDLRAAQMEASVAATRQRTQFEERVKQAEAMHAERIDELRRYLAEQVCPSPVAVASRVTWPEAARSHEVDAFVGRVAAPSAPHPHPG